MDASSLLCTGHLLTGITNHRGREKKMSNRQKALEKELKRQEYVNKKLLAALRAVEAKYEQERQKMDGLCSYFFTRLNQLEMQVRSHHAQRNSCPNCGQESYIGKRALTDRQPPSTPWTSTEREQREEEQELFLREAAQESSRNYLQQLQINQGKMLSSEKDDGSRALVLADIKAAVEIAERTSSMRKGQRLPREVTAKHVNTTEKTVGIRDRPSNVDETIRNRNDIPPSKNLDKATFRQERDEILLGIHKHDEEIRSLRKRLELVSSQRRATGLNNSRNDDR
eukprot:jgi/Bigna1/145588/aug1.101_g20296